MRPKYIKQLQHVSRDLHVMPINQNTLVVESRTDHMHNHVVQVTFLPDDKVLTRCTCEWSKHHGVACAHVMAALEFLAERKGRSLSFWLTEDEARRQKRRVFYMTHLEDEDADDGVWITSRAS